MDCFVLDEDLSAELNTAITEFFNGAVIPENVDYTFPEPSILHGFSSNIYYKSAQHKDWELLYETSKICTAQLFFSRSKWQLILVFKGTTLTSKQDVLADWNNIIKNKPEGAPNTAFVLGEEVRKLMQLFNLQLTITGHSLGGFLAQIAAYTIANLYVENGEICKTKRPHCGIHPHVVTFDSPSCFKMITKICGENPRSVNSNWFDVTNFIIVKNLINDSDFLQGVHMGKLIQIESPEVLENRSFWSRLWNPLISHKLEHFSNIKMSEAHEVTNIMSNTRELYDAKKVPCFAFSMEEWQMLHVAKCLMYALIEMELGFFTFEYETIILREPNPEFVLKARRFVAQNRADLNPERVQLLTQIEKLSFNLRAMSPPTSENYTLNEQVQEEIGNWKSGCCVSLPDYSPEDIVLLASFICNSSADSVCILQSQQNDDLLQTSLGTMTVYLVRDTINAVCAHVKVKENGPKVIFLGGSADCRHSVEFASPLTSIILDQSSRFDLAKHEVSFLGNDVQACEVFSDGLFEDVLIAKILTFEINVPRAHQVSHELTLESSNCEQDIYQIADEIHQGETSYAITCSGETGKSCILHHLRQVLQENSTDSWVIELDIEDIRERFPEVSMVNFEDAVRPENLNELQSMVFSKKLSVSKVLCLLDSASSLDSYAEKFLQVAIERNVRIILVKQELENVPLNYTIHSLEEHDENKQATLLLKCGQIDDIECARHFL